MDFNKFVESEKQFIGNLQILDLDFMTTIVKSNTLDSTEQILPFAKTIKDLIKLNTRFLTELKKIEKINTKPSKYLISSLLLGHLSDPNIRIYHKYLLYVPKMKILFTNESLKNLEFHKILNTLNISFEGLDFFTLLDLPIERIQIYGKISKDFLRDTSKDEKIEFDIMKYYTQQIERAILYTQPLVERNKVKISDPVLLGDVLLKHTSYLVEYKDIQLRKRYSDFEDLLYNFVTEFPNKTFPKFPEKNFLNRFHKHVVQERIEMFNDFFNEILNDVEIEASDVFHDFFVVPTKYDCEGTLLYSCLTPKEVEGGLFKLKADKLLIFQPRDKLPSKLLDLKGSKVKKISKLEKKIINNDFGLPFDFGFQIITIDKTVWFCYPKDEEELIWIEQLKKFSECELLSQDQVLSLEIKNKIYDEKVVQNLDTKIEDLEISSEKYQSFE